MQRYFKLKKKPELNEVFYRLALNEIKEKLELLDLSNNCLNHVPAQNLRNSLNMQYLDLSRNSISEIANFELINLPQLQVKKKFSL